MSLKIANRTGTCSTLILQSCFTDDVYLEALKTTARENFLGALKKLIQNAETKREKVVSHDWRDWRERKDVISEVNVLDGYKFSSFAFLYGTVVVNSNGGKTSFTQLFEYFRSLNALISEPEYNAKNETRVVGFIIPVSSCVQELKVYEKELELKKKEEKEIPL